uniref:Uncharacterized protein n=1 Tax=Amphimedon queenslandica TaxID=400682 RepID=A0A1X7UVH5_AMPQE
MLAVSSEHYHDAISAVFCVIDAIKASTTIWKKACPSFEVHEDGEGQWKANKECKWLNEDKR